MRELSPSLIKDLKELQDQINAFVLAINANPKNVSKYSLPLEKYKSALANIKQVLSEGSKKHLLGCSVHSMKVLTPASGFSRFSTFEVQLALEMRSRCDLTTKSIQIVYKKGKKETPSTKTIWEEYKKETLTIKDVLWSDENNAVVTISVDFGTDDISVGSATLALDDYFCKVQYILSTKIKLSTKEEAKKTVNNYKWLTTNQYIKEEDEELLKTLCPNLATTENTNQTKVYFDLSSLIEELNANPIFEAIKEEDYTTLKPSILKDKRKTYQTNLDALVRIEEKQVSNTETLEGLETNYTGKEEFKKDIFGEGYLKQIEQSKVLILLLREKSLLFRQAIQNINLELKKRCIPEEMLNTIAQLNTLKEESLNGLDRWIEKFESYEREELVFEEIKVALGEVTKYNTKVLGDWDQAFTNCTNLLESMLTNGTIDGDDINYKEWRREEYVPFKSFKKTIESKQEKILFFTDKYKRVIDKTGGDGVLEYEVDENKPSQSETVKFEKYDDSKLAYEDETGKDLFVDGASPEDVKQGELGDCYLMSALVSLAKGGSNKFLKEMIEDKGDICIVTLYQNGLPIKVEVDKKLLVRKKASKSITKSAGINDIVLYDYDHFLANHEDELWVAIIEKAYAKLLTEDDTDKGGDYTKIIGGTAASALKTLLGNRVSSPITLYLDDKGGITNTPTDIAIDNPIDLSKIDLNILKKVLMSASANDYEISLSSPETFNGVGGLTHDHILALGNSKYMSFRHAYSVIGATSGSVKAQNPHGDRNTDLSIFDKEVNDTMKELKETNDLIKSKVKEEKQFSNDLKTQVDELMKKLSAEDIFGKKLSVVIEKWGVLTSKGIVENSDFWKVKKWNLYEDWLKTLERIMKKDIGKGFVFRKINIKAVQDLSYSTLKEYFNLMTISIVDLK
ncbi:C2 family cysteine protease [Aureispira sp. CCB-QB1]|uniref:C2 family cysteine protease n=1 Tax=Aureispira sp. CCB-QB1 TaxID=1313421 RepID=UPI000697EAED|nr:C2 family cysteine protease [Aureispira sp. CCB-QB1]